MNKKTSQEKSMEEINENANAILKYFKQNEESIGYHKLNPLLYNQVLNKLKKLKRRKQ